MKTIDLRSDTVTLPCSAMKTAMVEAPLGDDVIDIDPTVQALQNKTAELLGKEAAIFMPSGSMTNQIAIRVHCSAGDEIICDESCHIYNYEQAAFAQLSGVVSRTVPGSNGIMDPQQMEGLVRGINEHMARTKLVCLENTHNMGGGKIYPLEKLTAICDWAHENGLKTHLDGARLFNAVVASGISAKQWAENFDTVSVCFSKGLGAPVGSALAGTKEDIQKARRHRKLFGGGMRQAGVIAAGALYALENNIERLAEDHASAQLIGEAIRNTEGLSLDPDNVDTNIVIFKVDPSLCTAAQFVEMLEQRGVRTYPFSSVHVRAVTHMHITPEDAKDASGIIKEVTALIAG